MNCVAAFLLLSLGAPAVAQEFPKPTAAGTKALDALVARCVAAGGLTEANDSKTDKPTFALADASKLKQSVVETLPAGPAVLRDALVARSRGVPASERAAITALLRALAEATEDDLTGAFADVFEGFERAITGSCGWRFEEGGVPLVNRKTTNRPKWPRSTPPWISLQRWRSPDQRPARGTS